MGDYLPDMATPRPSSIRTCLLEQHRALAATLDRVQQAAAGVAAAGHASIERALALCRELCHAFCDHLEFEDRLLVPALRETDAWGDVRAEQLSRKHCELRMELESLPREEPCGIEPCALAARLIAVIQALREDMLREEQGLLADEILRDDVIRIDNEDG